MTTPDSAQLFDLVQDCMIETLLIIHGHADRRHVQVTQVCERWTCIMAPWLRYDFLAGHRRLRGRWNGKMHQFTQNGRLRKRGIFKNGKAHGQYWSYWPKGTVMLTLTKGIGEGLMMRYRENGMAAMVGHSNNNKYNGKFTSFNEDGSVKATIGFRNHVKEGEYCQWYRDGQLSRRGIYRDGLKAGVWERWNEDGRRSTKMYPLYS